LLSTYLENRGYSAHLHYHNTINELSIHKATKHLKLSLRTQKALTEMHKANIALSSGKMSEEIQVPLKGDSKFLF
jgi:hypothetical protein